RAGDAAGLRTGVPAALLAIGFYWQVVPVMSGSLGSALDLRKLLIYPAPHGTLFLVEVLLRLTTGAEMVLVLLGGTVGLLRNRAAGVWAPAPEFGLPLLISLLFTLLLAWGLLSLRELFLSRRHIREVLVFIMLLAVTAPRLLILTGVGPRSAP